MARGLYIETEIKGSLDQVWELTQVPALHERWDLRFSSITYLPKGSEDEPQRFTYATRIGFGLNIEGTGESVATREAVGGVRTSSLRFWSGSPLSLIREGSGYWKYVPPIAGQETADSLRFFTWYDYSTRFGSIGKIADFVFRPLMGWATAWSFDRLRLWVERGIPPEIVRTGTLIYTIARLAVVFVWLWHGLVPKLLFRNADELAMLQSSGLSSAWLPWFGGAEVAFGLLGLVLWRWRGYLSLTAAAMAAALVGVALRSPAYLTAAFNPVTLNGGVFSLAAVAWLAWSFSAFAGRCRRRPKTATRWRHHE